jgi:hypothetical protein
MLIMLTAADTLLDFFNKYGAAFFQKRLFGGLARPLFYNQGIRQILKHYFGDTKMTQLKRKVIIPAFDLKNEIGKTKALRSWRPKIFDNTDDVLVIDALMASSAAPMYFPSHQGYIDGGVVLNNPAMAAVTHSLDAKHHHKKLEDIEILSIGTGMTPNVRRIDLITLNSSLVYRWGGFAMGSSRMGDQHRGAASEFIRSGNRLPMPSIARTSLPSSKSHTSKSGRPKRFKRTTVRSPSK